jgi:hypothetical protein
MAAGGGSLCESCGTVCCATVSFTVSCQDIGQGTRTQRIPKWAWFSDPEVQGSVVRRVVVVFSIGLCEWSLPQNLQM